MLADLLRSLAGLRLTDEDGETQVLELLPPATEAEMRKLEDALPAPLPEEIRAALGVSTGLANGPLESFSLLNLEGFGPAVSGDAVLAAFAATLPPEARIADLRGAHSGRRAGRDRLWALLPPERKPGLLQRLFGRSPEPRSDQ